MIFASAWTKSSSSPPITRKKISAPSSAAIRRDAPEYDILVVNDGSSDRTSAVARAFARVRVIDLPENIGIGGAVQTGFLFSLAAGYELAVQVDGDGQHRPSEIRENRRPRLVRRGRRRHRLAVSRKGDLPRQPVPPAGIRIFQMINAVFLGERITDSTSGFRAYNRRAIEILSETYPDDYPEPEAIYILKRRACGFRRGAVEMDSRAAGKSSIGDLAFPVLHGQGLPGHFRPAPQKRN